MAEYCGVKYICTSLTLVGNLWLDMDKLSEYEYWQFWRNAADDGGIRFLKFLMGLPLEEISKLKKLEGAVISTAKIVTADEATAVLHGRACLSAIHETMQTMFTGDAGATPMEFLPRVFV